MKKATKIMGKVACYILDSIGKGIIMLLTIGACDMFNKKFLKEEEEAQ